jgi:hypothetical protein
MRLDGHPRLGTCASEPPLPELRHRLEDAWSVRVINCYFTSEGASASKCGAGAVGSQRCGEMSIRWQYGWTEPCSRCIYQRVVDGLRCQLGRQHHRQRGPYLPMYRGRGTPA